MSAGLFFPHGFRTGGAVTQAGLFFPFGFRSGGAEIQAGLFPPFGFRFGPGIAVVPPEEEDHGAWSDYKQQLRLRLQLEYNYEPDGGLVFSGSAVYQHGVPFLRRHYVPQIGRTGDFGGSALVEAIRQFSVSYSGSGGFGWGSKAAVEVSAQQMRDAVGDGGIGLGGEAVTDHG